MATNMKFDSKYCCFWLFIPKHSLPFFQFFHLYELVKHENVRIGSQICTVIYILLYLVLVGLLLAVKNR